MAHFSNTVNPQLYTQQKYSFGNEGEIKTFSDEGKIREFVISRYTLKE